MSIPPLLQLKNAKYLAPAMFENKTPSMHVDVLYFLNNARKFLAICMFRGAGKTTTVDKTHMFNRIFLEHERYTQMFSVTQDKAKKFLNDLKQMLIEGMKKGFNIKKGRYWSSTEIEVIIDDKYYCFVEVMGAGQDPRGGTYNFTRPTLQIFDDVESKSGQYAITSKANREKLKDWFWGDCIPALDPIYGKVIFVGTILHEDSLLNNILKNDTFEHLKVPIITDQGLSAWKDRHPLTKDEARQKEQQIFKEHNKVIEIESIEDIKERYEKEGKLKLFYQEYMCQAQAEETRLFKEEYFKYYSHIEYSDKVVYLNFKNALETKRVPIREPKYIVLLNGKKIDIAHTIRYATMDLASNGKDKTVIIACAYDSNNNMYVLPIRAGNWTPFDKSCNVLALHKEFHTQKFGIEKAGMQNEFFYTIEEASKAMDIKVPVEPVSHGGIAKNIRISNLEPLFIVGKIFFCKSDPLTSMLEAQLLAFDLEVEGVDDLIDTLAYHLHFIKKRNFNYEEDEEEDEETVW